MTFDSAQLIFSTLGTGLIALLRERQQRELEREQMRGITERKIQTWKKTPSGQEKLQAAPTFMKALQKAVKQEDDRGKNMDDGKDRER